MAQLSDDCFAFGGPMMSVDEAVALIAARVAPVAEPKSSRCAKRTGACWLSILLRRCRCRLSPIPPSMVTPCAAPIFRGQAERALPVAGRVQAGAGARMPTRRVRGAHFHRRADARRGPTPSSCRKMSASMTRAASCCRAACKPGANVRPAGEDIVAGQSRCVRVSDCGRRMSRSRQRSA